MNQKNNFKNEKNNYDDEIDSFNEEEDNDLFISKKELVHIENDTSINVDKSFDEEHSKSSTLKKGGLIINNISAINEQISDKKIVEPNFFSKQINEELGNVNDIENKIESNPLNNYKEIPNNIQINPNNYFETFNNFVASEENNTQKNINILNNMIIGKTNYINYVKNKQKDYEKYSIYNFNHKYIGIKLSNINKKEEENISLKEYKNKIKIIKKEYDELNNTNKSLLELLTYWQKFFLEIKDIVLPEEKNFDKSINNYMDQSYKIKIIDKVKKVITNSRDKAYKNFYKTTINNFVILNNNNKYNKWKKNLLENRVESFCIKKINLINDDLNENINNLKISKKFLDESDDLDFLPPIKYIEKVNIGINTDNIDNNNNECFFDSTKLFINNKVTFFEIKGNKYNKNAYKIKTRSNKILSDLSNKSFSIKKKEKELQISKLENLFIKSKPIILKKFKKNTTYKLASIQTDITNDNINELLNYKKEKEKIQKQYEEKINILNNYIKNNNSNINRNNSKINNYKILKNNKENDSPSRSINNNSKIFLPEMIPPEHTYKIFINCIKNFKYEEGIYQKYIKEEDLYNLKYFVEKMEKYLLTNSLPILKAVKRKDYVIHTKENNESFTQKKYKEKKLFGNKDKLLNVNQKKRNTSNSKNNDNRSNSVLNNKIIFNKYKTSIMYHKDN